MDSDPTTAPPTSQPSALRWILGFICVGLAWGFTTPFIRRGAVNFSPPEHPSVNDPSRSFLYRKLAKVFFTVTDLLRSPGYAVPLLLNMTGSVWFFILVGSAELSLTVPIVNSLAFLFTVVGEWWVEGRVISRNTWVGMGLVLGGIGLCVWSKS